MFDFRPTKTPLGMPVRTAFELFGACYAVDMLDTCLPHTHPRRRPRVLGLERGNTFVKESS